MVKLLSQANLFMTEEILSLKDRNCHQCIAMNDVYD
jgi:hypothetical protein